jgi:Spy/CpxP family protein refolding chaperone
MKRFIVALAVVSALPAPGFSQVVPRGSQADTAQRAALEARVLQRFVERTAAELSLTESQATRLHAMFERNMERRRQAARESAEIRRQLAAAVREPGTTDADFQRHLTALQTLRQREHELWQREQQALAELLTPRQRAQYMTRWMALQENIRDVMARRGRPPGLPRR